MIINERLTRIVNEMSTCRMNKTPVVMCDKWVLSSGMQKSIRRGDVKRAASFAYSLGMQDRRSLWRRLLVTAFEDIGIANTEVVMEVVAAYKSPVWRRSVGDVEVAVHLARKMAAGIKSRYLTEAFFYSDLAVDTTKVRSSITKASNKKLESIILDTDKMPEERFVALWGLAGTKQYPAKGFTRIGDVQACIKTLRELPVETELAELCIATLQDTQYPLALFLPLAMDVLRDEQQHFRIEKERPLGSLEFEGVPTFSIDPLYTRVGGSALRQLQKTVPALKGFSPAQLGETLFFIEGENIDQRLTSDALDQFRQRSVEALMQDLGLDSDAYAALRRCLIKHFDLYNDFRIQQLERSLYGAEKDLLSAVVRE